MTVKDPQYDLRPGLSGGSDVWDQGPAGVLLGDDYFTVAAPASAPVLKRWNGSAWIAAVVKHGAGWPEVQIATL